MVPTKYTRRSLGGEPCRTPFPISKNPGRRVMSQNCERLLMKRCPLAKSLASSAGRSQPSVPRRLRKTFRSRLPLRRRRISTKTSSGTSVPAAVRCDTRKGPSCEVANATRARRDRRHQPRRHSGPSTAAGTADALAHPALVDGLPGVLITVGGRPVTVMAFTVTNGAITAIHALTAPTRLGQVVPPWVA
jgi:hypothetical protein